MPEGIASQQPEEGAPQRSAVQCLTFTLGARRYAMPTARIVEITGVTSFTEVPLMPDCVRGVMNVRGAVLPVIDLCLRFGLAAMTLGRRSCVVILEQDHADGALRIGALVDVVHAVIELPLPRIQAVVAGVLDIPRRFAAGQLQLNEEVVLVLDMGQVLAVDELAALAAVGRPLSADAIAGTTGASG
jgi:purine-binding chemotaxis protein CheW